MQPTTALCFIADEMGYFCEEGVRVTVTEFPSGKRAMKDGLITERVDMVVSSDIPVVMAALDGHAPFIIASLCKADNVNRVVARRDRGIHVPADLAGKTVGTQRASAVHCFLGLFLMEHDVRQEEANVVYMKAEELVPALLSGTIDAFSMREPYVTEAVNGLGDNVVVFSAPGLYSQVELLLASKQIMQRCPDVGVRVLRALMKAETYALGSPDEARRLVARRIGADDSEMEKIWETIALTVRLDQSTLLLLENEARWAIAEGLTEADRVPDFLELIDLHPLDAVRPEAVSIFR